MKTFSGSYTDIIAEEVASFGDEGSEGGALQQDGSEEHLRSIILGFSLKFKNVFRVSTGIVIGYDF